MIKVVTASLLLFICCSCIDFKNYESFEFANKTIKPDSFVFIPISHIQQKKNYCVVASTTMLLNYQNIKVTQQETTQLFENSPNNGLFIKETIRAAKLIGGNWIYHTHGLLDKKYHFEKKNFDEKLILKNKIIYLINKLYS